VLRGSISCSHTSNRFRETADIYNQPVKGGDLRRIIIAGAALVVLGGAGVAFAATNFNNYKGSKLAITAAKGTKKHPVPLGMIETLHAGAPAGDRAAPLTNIKVKIYGVKLDVGKLPVCSDSKIEQKKTSPTGNCPKGSQIGTCRVNALLGPSTSPSMAGSTACNPYLNVFNGGPTKQIFYFWTKSASDCGGLTTGSTAPWDGKISYGGGFATINVKLPPDISTKVANQPGLYGSLIKEVVNFAKKSAGKVYMAGIGCKGNKRPWSITFTASDYNTGASETQTVSGSAKC